MIQYEYKINYVIKNVMRFRGMDRIHSMVVYLPLVSENIYEFFSSNKYPLNFLDGTIYFSCRENATQLMYEMYNSTRSVFDVVNYLNSNDSISNLNEWTNCFELVYDNGLYDYFVKNRKVCKNSKSILKHIIKCIDSINNDRFYFNEDMIDVKVCDLKYYYKSIVMDNVYKMFAIFFRLDNSLKMINIFEFMDKKIFDDDFFDKFFGYIDCIQKLQFLLDYIDLDLSSHSERVINMNELNNQYFEFTGNKSIIADLNLLKKELYALCISYLSDKECEFNG